MRSLKPPYDTLSATWKSASLRKTKNFLNLRRKNVTLDNFRLVLDHEYNDSYRNEGLSLDRGLEAHITAMYDELEADYYERKRRKAKFQGLHHPWDRRLQPYEVYFGERDVYCLL